MSAEEVVKCEEKFAKAKAVCSDIFGIVVFLAVIQSLFQDLTRLSGTC